MRGKGTQYGDTVIAYDAKTVVLGIASKNASLRLNPVIFILVNSPEYQLPKEKIYEGNVYKEQETQYIQIYK